MSGGKGDDQFAQYAAAVAQELWGEPNKALSSKNELRFGDRGSRSVDLTKGTWHDHKEGIGGGVLSLIERETGKTVKGGQAVEWLREHGFHVEDRSPPNGSAGSPRQGAGSAQSGDRGEYKPPRFTKGGHRIPADRIPDHAELTRAYDYLEADGTLRYQVVRFDWDDPDHPKGHDKTFLQRRPEPKNRDGWTYSVKGTEPLPYRLPELLEDIANGDEVFIVEGEKKVDMLRDIGVPATCNSGGGKKFPEALVDWFKDASVTLLGDNDDVGREHVKLVAARLAPVAKRIRALDLPGLPPNGGVDDWLPAGGSADQLYELAARLARPIEAAPYESKFGAVFWRDVDAEGPAYEYLIKDLLTRGEMSMTAGESGSGKTFFVLGQAMAVCRGVEFFGRRVRQGGVIYQAGEGARAFRRKRLRAYREHFGCQDENVPFVLLEKPIDLYSSEDHTEAFIEEARALARYMHVPLELIVIDTLSKATPGINENDSADIGRVLERCDRIRRATGAHIQIVHHMNAEGAKPRGHTSLLANIETVIVTRKVEDHHDADGRMVREFELRKQKEGEAGTKTRFVLQEVKIGIDEDGDPITSCVVARPSGSAADASKPVEHPQGVTLGGQNAKVLRALYDVLETKGIFAPAELGLPFGTQVASRKDHGARYAELESPDDRKPEEMAEDERKAFGDRLRQQLKRARDLLYTKKIIGLDEQWIWLTGKQVQGFGPPPGTQRKEKKKEEEPVAPENLPFAAEDFDPMDM
ncbi:primase DnaG/twinkle [Microcystis phage Mae-JY30]